MAVKFAYYNDTNRVVTIHPATKLHGCDVDTSPIQQGQCRVFTLPEGTIPWMKMWDYGEMGLSILVSPFVEVAK